MGSTLIQSAQWKLFQITLSGQGEVAWNVIWLAPLAMVCPFGNCQWYHTQRQGKGLPHSVMLSLCLENGPLGFAEKTYLAYKFILWRQQMRDCCNRGTGGFCIRMFNSGCCPVLQAELRNMTRLVKANTPPSSSSGLKLVQPSTLIFRWYCFTFSWKGMCVNTYLWV